MYQDIASAVTSKQNGDSRGATATLDRTLSELNSSSNRGEAEVQALIKDVEKAKQEVSGSGVSSDTGIRPQLAYCK